MKRTDKDTLNDIDDAPDIQRLVADKRESKRATPAKGRRRNRRYENRIISAQVQDDFDNEDGSLEYEDEDRDSKFINS
jgi:hypothetical protein